MRYVDEYRDPTLVQSEVHHLKEIVRRSVTVMEICGGQTNSIMKYGLQDLIPKEIELVHGPGCPVCVTPLELIDRAVHLALLPEVIFCSFGDMLRVPGSQSDLFNAKAQGGDVRTVYSPLEAAQLAEAHPEKEVIFFAIGFETTAPANAMALFYALRKGLKNFSLLVSHFLVPPAMEAILSSPKNRIEGFLAAGHVCTVMGYEEYLPIAERYKVPIVVTGFEPVDLLQGLIMLVKQLNEGRYEVENQYVRSVRREGNHSAMEIMDKLFERSDRIWRGIGSLPMSGLRLKREYQQFDAEEKFSLSHIQANEDPDCISGLIMQGEKKPFDCTHFGKRCNPENPIGAPMVSTEGVCSAYFRYSRKSGGATESAGQ